MRKVTVDEIREEIIDVMASDPIPHAKRTPTLNKDRDHLLASWEWGYKISAVLLVHFDFDKESNLYHPTIRVSWPSSYYSPVAARTAANLHSQVADLACRISTLLEEVHIVARGED